MNGIELKTFLEYKYISNLRLNKEKNLLGFVLSEANLEDNNYTSNIYTYDLKTKETRKMTSTFSESSFEFYENSIIFSGNRSKKEKELSEKGLPISNFYRLRLDGGESQKIFSIPFSVLKYEFLDEDNLILLGKTNEYSKSLLNINKLKSEDKDKAIKEVEEKIQEEKDFERFDEIPFWSNGSGFNYGNTFSLYKYNIKTKDLTRITRDNIEINSMNVVNEKVYLTYNEVSKKMDLYSYVGVLDLKDLELKTLFSDKNYNFYYVTELDGKVVSIGNDLRELGLNGNPRFYEMKDGSLEKISPDDFDRSISSTVNTDSRLYGSKTLIEEKDRLYFNVLDGFNTDLYSTSPKGDFKKEIDFKGSIDGIQIGENGEVFLVGFVGDALQEIYKYQDGNLEKLTSFNDEILEKYQISTPEHIVIKNKDVKLDGFIMKPIGFKKGEKYKTILEIHGGPKTAFGSIFFSEMQYLANLGYVVIYTNPRGSDGKGNEFSDIRGKYGSIDYDDIMYFTKEMVKKYDFIDEEKIGVTGGSYGGYMTNWIVGHTDYFKAAVTQRSISNWISKFNTTDIGYYFVGDQVDGNPWDDTEKLWDNSPLKYANNVKTPTLIIHSEEDLRCDVNQAYQFFTALKYFGVDAEMLLIKGENHDLSRSGKPKSRIKRLEAISDWFERKL